MLFMVGYMYTGVLGAHVMQKGSGPCKIPNLLHLLCSYVTYMYFMEHLCIDKKK